MNFYSKSIARRIAKVKPVVVYPDSIMVKTLVITCRNGRELDRISVRAKASRILAAYDDVYASKCAEAKARGWYLFCDNSEGRMVRDAA